MPQPHILILAGANGSGKTTFARQFLSDEADYPKFINSDFIAAGLSPFTPEQAAVKAGRLMLQAIRQAVAKGENFAFETTLSGCGYARKIPQWRDAGYRITLYFLKINTVELAIDRVAERVRHGGHNIPEAVIRRRFVSGWRNFQNIYCHLVDEWEVIDNSNNVAQLLEASGNHDV